MGKTEVEKSALKKARGALHQGRDRLAGVARVVALAKNVIEKKRSGT